jgi:small-conductance mechanosensitive channel
MQEIKERFDREGIEIPFPHISVYTGTATAPFPVQFTPGNTEGKTQSDQGDLDPGDRT